MGYLESKFQWDNLFDLVKIHHLFANKFKKDSLSETNIRKVILTQISAHLVATDDQSDYSGAKSHL